MVNHPWEYYLDTFPHSLHMILQTRTSHCKIASIASIGIRFFLIPFCFLRTPLHGLAYYNLKFQSMLVSFISQSLLNGFQSNLYYCLPYSCSTSRTIFSFILWFKVIPEHTLHSRVKYSIAQISNVISSSNFKRSWLYKCYSTFLCKTIILVTSYAEFFKVRLNDLNLFILLMHILIFKQVHVIHTYISYCFVLWSQWFMHSLDTNYAT